MEVMLVLAGISLSSEFSKASAFCFPLHPPSGRMSCVFHFAGHPAATIRCCGFLQIADVYILMCWGYFQTAFNVWLKCKNNWYADKKLLKAHNIQIMRFDCCIQIGPKFLLSHSFICQYISIIHTLS